MTYVSDTLRRLVRDRANRQCEYCLIHEEDTLLTHEIDHIVAQKHGGETTESNLCLACERCNRYKGSDLSSIDPESGGVITLYNPRLDNWDTHFALDGAIISPLTPTGRATVRLLQFNSSERVTQRTELISVQRYPPE